MRPEAALVLSRISVSSAAARDATLDAASALRISERLISQGENVTDALRRSGYGARTA